MRLCESHAARMYESFFLPLEREFESDDKGSHPSNVFAVSDSNCKKTQKCLLCNVLTVDDYLLKQRLFEVCVGL